MMVDKVDAAVETTGFVKLNGIAVEIDVVVTGAVKNNELVVEVVVAVLTNDG
jgi:hypothetical protein